MKFATIFNLTRFLQPGCETVWSRDDTYDSVASIVRPDEADQSTDSTLHKLHNDTYYNAVYTVAISSVV